MPHIPQHGEAHLPVDIGVEEPSFATQQQQAESDEKAGQQCGQAQAASIAGAIDCPDGEETKPGQQCAAQRISPRGRDIEKAPEQQLTATHPPDKKRPDPAWRDRGCSPFPV